MNFQVSASLVAECFHHPHGPYRHAVQQAEQDRGGQHDLKDREYIVPKCDWRRSGHAMQNMLLSNIYYCELQVPENQQMQGEMSSEHPLPA